MRRYLALLPVYWLAACLPLAAAIGRNLEYEYALLAAYAALLLIPVVGVLMPRRWLPLLHGRYFPPVAFEFLWILVLSPVFAVVPGAALYATHHCACSAPGFAFWMLTLWYPAWVLAHAFLHAVLRARCHGWGRFGTSLGLGLSYLVLTSYAVATLWLAPQKHLLNLFTGFWHGPIYDASIGVDEGILWTRGVHLIAALLLLCCLWLRRSVLSVAALLVVFGGWYFAAEQAAKFPSAQNTRESLDALLPAKLSGSGFTIHYLAAAEAKEARLEIQRLARDAEFHIAELTQVLDLSSAERPTVEIYAYPDRDRKKLWFGAGATDVTDVHTPSVHITTETWPHPTLRHELVHALSSRFGYHGLGFHPNMAFTEGLAVALAPTPDSLSLDDGAASLIASGKLPQVDKLFSPMFWTAAGERAYTVAGSFLQYLIATQGIAGVKALYSGKDWQTAFGQSQDGLLSAWQRRITEHFDPAETALYSEALYRYPGVLQDLCPHSKADLSRRREDSAFIRMRQPLGWDTETAYLPWLQHLDPSDREPPLKIWRAEVNRLATDRVVRSERLSSMRETLAGARHSPAKNLEDIELGILEADVLRIQNDVPGSRKLLESLLAESKQHYFGETLLRELVSRLTIESGAGGPLALEWRRYLAGWRKALPTTALYGEPWLLTYLKVRNPKALPVELNLGDLRRLLTEALPDPQLPRTFAHEWYKILAGRFMELGAYPEAGVAYDKAADAALPAARAVFGEHARRARFYATKGALAAATSGEKKT